MVSKLGRCCSFESRNIRIVFGALWLLFYVVLYWFYCLYYCVIDRCKSFLEFAFVCCCALVGNGRMQALILL